MRTTSLCCLLASKTALFRVATAARPNTSFQAYFGSETTKHNTRDIFTSVMPQRRPWTCSGSSNQELIEHLKEAGLVGHERVGEAMLQVDRGNYAPLELGVYMDSPQPIGHGATISAPHMHAAALSNLEPFLQPGMKALDVGSGTGYLTACMAAMVGEKGKVVGIDHITELVEMSEKNIRKDHPEYLESGRIQLVVGDGRKGFAQDAPYDCIHVGAAAPHLPNELVDQLKAPGRMFIPVGTTKQRILQVDKDQSGKVMSKEIMPVMYVPLTDKEKQRRI